MPDAHEKGPQQAQIAEALFVWHKFLNYTNLHITSLTNSSLFNA